MDADGNSLGRSALSPSPDSLMEHLREQNRSVVARAVDDVNDIDSLFRLDHAVEDLVVTVNPMTDSVSLVAGHQRERERHVGKVQTFGPQLLNERYRPARVVERDVIADGFKVEDGFREYVNDHALSVTIA